MRTAPTLALTALVLVGMLAPAGALAAGGGADGPGIALAPAGVGASAAANNSSVNVTVGRQLATVVEVSGDDVATEVEEASFEAAFEDAGEEERAELLAERAEEIRETAGDIREDYREARREYEAGDISKEEFARRLASLNARASNLLERHDALRRGAANISGFELRAAGLNRTVLERSLDDVENVTGVGARELLRRFTGQGEGELELETGDGLSIEAESEDGERSRELRRPRDDDDDITVSLEDARATATAALSSPANGSWSLSKSSVHHDSGYLKFEYSLESNGSDGEAEVRVDGTTGEVFRLEEEIEAGDDDGDDADEDGPDDETDEDGPDDEEDGDDEDDDDGDGDDAEDDEDDEEDGDDAEDRYEDLALTVVDGEPAPGATVVVGVQADGEPVADANVSLNGELVGETDADGTISVALPAAGEAEIVARAGDEDAELEFEFGGEDDGVVAGVNATGSHDDGTVTLALTYEGEPIENVTVYADDERVGVTGADGTVTFETSATDELELEAVKGELEVELTLEIDDGTVTVSGEPREGDGDKLDDEDGDSDDADGDDTDVDDEEDGDDEGDSDDGDDDDDSSGSGSGDGDSGDDDSGDTDS